MTIPGLSIHNRCEFLFLLTPLKPSENSSYQRPSSQEM